MPAIQAAASRPPTVTAAFWCWVVAAILIAALGLITASENTMVFFRTAGVFLVIIGLVHGYLAGRARRGQQRFANAGVGLALASVVFLGGLIMFGAGLVGVLMVAAIMALMITGSVLIRRESAAAWFERKGAA